MSIGAGVLLAGVSLKVAADALKIIGSIPAALALLAGAALFSSINALLSRFGATHRKRCGECVQQPREAQQPGSGAAIVVGNAFDALPEALVLGIVLQYGTAPIAIVVAFALSSLPEALSSASGMREAGRSPRYILWQWGAIAAGTVAATLAGYFAFGQIGDVWPARLQALAAGALLAMAAETIIPEAFHGSPRFSGLLAAVGFGFLLLVDAMH
jgi:ZIP family zinc transporter